MPFRHPLPRYPSTRLASAPTVALTLALGVAALTGCAGDAWRAGLADIGERAAARDWCVREVHAGRYDLRMASACAAQGGVPRVYIEGDGRAWISRHRPSDDPTPGNPLGLALALADPAPGAVWLSRPCQFLAPGQRAAQCQTEDWTQDRYAASIVAAYVDLIATLATPDDGVELAGYSGGGGLAALVAAGLRERGIRVRSLVTVAGNLDHRLQSRLLGVSELRGSRNPIEVAARLRDVPQVHWVGRDDRVVPGEIAQAWRAASGPGACVEIRPLDGVSHAEGWRARWAALATYRPTCTGRDAD